MPSMAPQASPFEVLRSRSAQKQLVSEISEVEGNALCFRQDHLLHLAERIHTGMTPGRTSSNHGVGKQATRFHG